jgi:hypothetical protein
VLADAHVPPAQEMRDALTGELITQVPLGKEYFERFGQPYALTHRADLHAVLPAGLPGQQSRSRWRTIRRVVDHSDDGGGVTVRLDSGEEIKGRALIGCDGMWSRVREKIVGDGKPRVSGHIAYRAVLRRADVPDDLWRPEMVLWAGPRTHFVHYPLRRGELYNLVAVFHSDHYQEGWNAEGSRDVLWRHFAMQRPEVLRLLERIETWRMWVLCDREPIKEVVERQCNAARRCRAPDAAISRARAPAWRPRTPYGCRERSRRRRTIWPARSAPTRSSATCVPGRCRSWRAFTENSIMRAASPRSCAIACWRRARRRIPTRGSPGSMAASDAGE